MGYLVVAHVTASLPDTAKLSILPSSIEWALHKEEGMGGFYINTYKPGSKQDWPFTSMPPMKDIPLEFAPGLEPLVAVYRALEEAHLAYAFERGFLNLNLMISKALGIPVCSCCSNDDGLDFACLSENGQLLRLHCECGDLDILYEDAKVTVQPLLLEDGDPTNIAGLHDPQNGVYVRDKNVDQSSLLHKIASEEVTNFLGVKRTPLGLGSFDGMEVPPIKIAGSGSS